jgi:two-component system response regulator RstA
MPHLSKAIRIAYIVDGKEDIPSELIHLLRSHHMIIDVTRLDRDNLSPAVARSADLVTLDVKIPLGESLSVCKVIRSCTHVPIMIVSKCYTDLHHIQALSNGADDVVKKPFNSLLLVAKMNALVRRYGQAIAAKTTKEACIKCGELTVNLAKRDVIARGRDAFLTSIEFDIFNFLMRNAGSIVSRNDIHRALYNSDHNGFDRSLDIYISRIRQKIGDDVDKPKYLKTVRGAGYLFVGDIA